MLTGKGDRSKLQSLEFEGYISATDIKLQDLSFPPIFVRLWSSFCLVLHTVRISGVGISFEDGQKWQVRLQGYEHAVFAGVQTG